MHAMLNQYRRHYFVITRLTTNPANTAVKSYQVKPDGVTFKVDKGLMKVIVCKEDINE